MGFPNASYLFTLRTVGGIALLRKWLHPHQRINDSATILRFPARTTGLGELLALLAARGTPVIETFWWSESHTGWCLIRTTNR
jgi:hypothetical protein